MKPEPESWEWSGPPESLDEAIHLRVACAACGSSFDDYLLWPRVGELFSLRHPGNDRPPLRGWRRVSPRPRGRRGPLRGAAAHTTEEFGGRYYYRWRCGNRVRRCRASPKIAVSELVARALRRASEDRRRPIELRL